MKTTSIIQAVETRRSRREAFAAVSAQRDELLAALERMQKFAFIDRWASKGLDDEAQKLHDANKALIAKVRS